MRDKDAGRVFNEPLTGSIDASRRRNSGRKGTDWRRRRGNAAGPRCAPIAARDPPTTPFAPPRPSARAPAPTSQVGNAISDSLCFVLVGAGVLMNRNRLTLVRQGIYKRFLSLDYSTQARRAAEPRALPPLRPRPLFRVPSQASC